LVEKGLNKAFAEKKSLPDVHKMIILKANYCVVFLLSFLTAAWMTLACT